MSTPMTGAQATQLDSDIRHLIQVVSQNTRAQLAALPQWWCAEDLAKRWHRGRDEVNALLYAHSGYVGERGKPMRIHVDDVLKIDEVLLAEYRARRAALVGSAA
jgi:hypothetical protein